MSLCVYIFKLSRLVQLAKTKANNTMRQVSNQNFNRFFNLLDKTLQSTHVPESVMVSFVKKLARLSLVAPPNGCLLCCKMVINLTKRHHLQYLIHREDNSTVVSFFGFFVMIGCQIFFFLTCKIKTTTKIEFYL